MTLPRRSFILPASRIQPPKKRWYGTEHIKVTLRVEMDRKRLVGVATLKVIPSRIDLQKIDVDACEMDIEGVAVDGTKVPFEYDNETLSIRAGGLGTEAHQVDVHYSTTSTNQGIYFVGPDEKYPTKPLQAWTHSETQNARYWYPCNDQPDDRATSEMVITVPVGFRCISNGKLLSRTVQGVEVTYHWSEGTAHSTYLNSLAIGRFEEIAEEADGVPLLYYFDQSNWKDALRFFGETPNMLREYNKMIALPYPYEQYAQVCVSDFTSGGMEHISATTMTDKRFPDERSEEDYSSTYSRPDRTPRELVAHELAHQWYGDLVTMSDWPHAWLNEGFATYFEALYVERVYGVEEFRQDMAYKAIAHRDEDEKRYRRPVVEKSFVYPDDLFDSALYEKASWMLHQLRFVLGDETFFKGMTAYVKKFAEKNPDTENLKEVLEEVSGRGLGPEFDQFFYKPGHPEFEVEYSWDHANSTAELLVRQVQETSDGTPIFDLPCDVVFYCSKGRNKTRIRLSKREEKFSFKLDDKPTIVEFDPEEWLLKTVKFRKTFDALVSQLESSLDATSRVRAAQDLAEFKTDKSVDALAKVLQSEQFWSVKAEAARSLGKVETPAALAILLSAIGARHRKVRRAVVEGLGHFKGEDVETPLRKILMEDISPNIQAEAALSLSKTGKKDVFQDLKVAMKIPSPNWTLTEACLEAMGRIKDSQAKKVLDDHLPYGIPTRARIGALKGLKERGFLDEVEVAALREILTSDKEFAVRLQIVSLVSDLMDGRFLEVLERTSEEDVDKRVRRRALEVIHEITKTQGAARIESQLKDELAKLIAENQRLKDEAGSRI